MGILTTFLIGAVAGGTTWELYKRREELTWTQVKSLFQRKQTTAVSEPGDPETATIKLVFENLEAIHGIGPVYARRLNEAGILTYADLAQATPEQLKTIVAPQGGPMPDVAAWLAEARQLVAATNA